MKLIILILLVFLAGCSNGDEITGGATMIEVVQEEIDDSADSLESEKEEQKNTKPSENTKTQTKYTAEENNTEKTSAEIEEVFVDRQTKETFYYNKVDNITVVVKDGITTAECRGRSISKEGCAEF